MLNWGRFYLRQGDYVFNSVCLFVCLDFLKYIIVLKMQYCGGAWGGDLDHDPALVEVCAFQGLAI